MKAMRSKEFHKKCFACGEHTENGLKLKFELLDDGTLYSEFKINKKYQGYDNKSHGGIVSTILVSSMVNLFYIKNGLELSTARLNIRFRKPIPVEKTFAVTTVVQGNIRHFYRAKSQIIIDDVVFVEAEGYFKRLYPDFSEEK
ncbi:MAG: hypothetical protein U9N73_05055 [Candidatus Auribacterota bacterium]|nr:hypothetical protein [Candidatus Auribacterota bacterium]